MEYLDSIRKKVCQPLYPTWRILFSLLLLLQRQCHLSLLEVSSRPPLHLCYDIFSEAIVAVMAMVILKEGAVAIPLMLIGLLALEFSRALILIEEEEEVVV